VEIVAQEFPSFPFNTLEGQVAPQNSFISIQLADSNPIGSTNLELWLRGRDGSLVPTFHCFSAAFRPACTVALAFAVAMADCVQTTPG
jgi:hypothetical protein